MNQRPALIWDFDGTLAYQEGKWSGAMLAAMDELVPGLKLIKKRAQMERTGRREMTDAEDRRHYLFSSMHA